MRSAGPLLLEVARHAAERAAGASRAGERVDAAVRLVPDLGAGGGVVRVAVRGVVELVAADGALDFRGNARRELLVVIVVGVRDGLHDLHFGAERAQQRRLLGRLVVRHHDHAAVTARIAEVREADAGVARRALDQRAAGLEQPLALEVFEDAAGGAVLDRAAGVQELGLAEDLAAGLVAEPAQTDQRRVADGVGEAIADGHGVLRGWGPRHSSGKARALWAARLDYRLSGSARQGENFGGVHLDGRATAELRKAASRVCRVSKFGARYPQRDLTVPHRFEADGRSWLDTQKSANALWNRYPPSRSNGRGPIWPESIH